MVPKEIFGGISMQIFSIENLKEEKYHSPKLNMVEWYVH